MKKRFQKIYLEITNLCNLNCSFCPGTKRKKAQLTEEEFLTLLPKLRDWTDYLYFHLMGEPLRHPLLENFLQHAGDAGFKVILTTNGVLLPDRQEVLLRSPGLHKVNISLHAFEANDLAIPFDTYLNGCFSFGKAAEGKKIVVYRLWNEGGANALNDAAVAALQKYFPQPWKEGRRGIEIGERIFLEYGDRFDWPDLQAAEYSGHFFCYGLRDQLGVLCDGTVVPCCLDHEGDLALGNLFTNDLADILSSPRALSLLQGFSDGKASEELCRKCGYARRFVSNEE